MCVGNRSSFQSVRFVPLLRCVHKRIVNIIEVYIERNNIQVELIRSHTNFIDVYVCEASEFANH